MRTDAANQQHPDWDDIPTSTGYLHIAGCEQCTHTFDGPILWYAREEQAREDNKPRRH